MNPNYRWGVPTRSCVKDEEYQKLCRLMTHALKVSSIPDLTSGVALNAQVARVLKRTKTNWVDAQTLYQHERWGQFLSRFLPQDFSTLLNLDWLIEHLLTQIEVADSALNIAKNKIEKQLYDQTRKFLDILQSQLHLAQAAEERKRNPLVRIQFLWWILKHNEANFSAAIDDLRFFPLHIGSELNSHEQRPEDKAFDLFKEHAAATQNSDIFVGFDEISAVIRNGNSATCLPLDSMFGQPFLTSDGLVNRTGFHDLIRELLERQEKIVVNGREFRLLESKPQYGIIICETAGEPPQNLVDLLGIHVLYKWGIVHPNRDFLIESSWVRGYRLMAREQQLEIPPYGWTKFLLGKYNGLQEDYGIPLTDEQKVKLLYRLLSQPARLNDFSSL